jgi:hypothetical protein
MERVDQDTPYHAKQVVVTNIMTPEFYQWLMLVETQEGHSSSSVTIDRTHSIWIETTLALEESQKT